MSYTFMLPSKQRSTRTYMGDKVKIGFSKGKDGKTKLILYIGKDRARSIGLTEGSKIRIGVNDANPLVWLVLLDPLGYSVFNTRKTGTDALYRCVITWPHDVPETIGYSTKFCTLVDNYEGGLRLFLPGTTIEDKAIIA